MRMASPKEKKKVRFYAMAVLGSRIAIGLAMGMAVTLYTLVASTGELNIFKVDIGYLLPQIKWLERKPPAELADFVPDDPPRSKNAYISDFSGDDKTGHYFLLSIVAGYNLMRLDNRTDRVLIVPNKSFLTPSQITLLKKVWTHIIVREYISWPKGLNESKITDKDFWFKFNAWTVTGYEKLYWTGTDVLFLKSPSTVFDWPTPSSCVDFHLFSVSRYGPIINGDCFLFKPSLEDFNGLVNISSKVLQNPMNHLKDKDFPNEVWMGPFDQGILNQYFKGGITILPQWFQYELPGNERSMYKTWKRNLLDDRVVSFHYPVMWKPWRKYMKEYTDAWTYEMIDACKYVDFNVTISKYKIRNPTNRDIRPGKNLSV